MSRIKLLNSMGIHSRTSAAKIKPPFNIRSIRLVLETVKM